MATVDERVRPDASTAPLRRTFALLWSLHASQYLAVNFFHITVIAVLRDRGAPLRYLAIINLVGVLLAVKILWAPLLDKYGSARLGHYRSWLLGLQPLLAAVLLLMLPLDPVDDFPLLIVVAAVAIQLAAMQDVATDALAVHVLAARDRAFGSGVRIAGGYLGHIVGGGLLLLLLDRYGWGVAIAAAAILIAAPGLQLASYREQALPPAHVRHPGYRNIINVFREPGVRRWAFALLPLPWIGVTASYALLTPMLVDGGWGLDRVGLVTGIVGSVCGGFAALGAAAVIRRVGRRWALVVCGFLLSATLLGLAPLASGHVPYAPTVAAVLAFGIAYAALSVVINTITMDLSRSTAAASDFTVLASFGLLVSLVGGAVALLAADRIGYLPVLLVATACVIVGALVNAKFYIERVT